MFRATARFSFIAHGAFTLCRLSSLRACTVRRRRLLRRTAPPARQAARRRRITAPLPVVHKPVRLCGAPCDNGLQGGGTGAGVRYTAQTQGDKMSKYSKKPRKLLYYHAFFRILLDKNTLNSAFREFATHYLTSCCFERKMPPQPRRKESDDAFFAPNAHPVFPPCAHVALPSCTVLRASARRGLRTTLTRLRKAECVCCSSAPKTQKTSAPPQRSAFCAFCFRLLRLQAYPFRFPREIRPWEARL